MRNRLVRIAVISAIVVLSGMAARIAAQSGRASQTEDVLGALLVEVRGLRTAMEQMASAGPRAQLALARLQLQEQRINTLLRRVEVVRDNLARVRAEATEIQTDVASFETALRTRSMPPEQRAEVENALAGRKRDLARPSAEVQRLTAEEASLASEINTEQGRWADFNQRLEELERALVRR